MRWTNEPATDSIASFLLMATSFSTTRSSNVWGMKVIFLSVFPQTGHGAGPKVYRRSIQDSHLVAWSVSERAKGGYNGSRDTFCDNTSSRANGALGSSICPICTLDIDRPWTLWHGDGQWEGGQEAARETLTKYSDVLPEPSLTPPLNTIEEDVCVWGV